jgi:RimJ/RimL family protein N-acetyltransferase
MLIDHWPLAGLTLTTPDLVLRLPNPEELAELADVAAAGVHEPGFMPFLVPWTDAPAEEVARSVILHFWRRTGLWSKDDWTVLFTIFHQGKPIGLQALKGEQFAITREVSTGSWLGLPYHGKGFGSQMRTAVLELAFTGLGAETAASAALVGNESSLGVSRKLGYREDGQARHVVQGKVRHDQRLRLDRKDWVARYPVQIDGLERCLPFFGL